MYLDDLAMFELLELFGAQEEGFFGFKGDERCLKDLDGNIFLALFAKVEAAGRTLVEQLCHDIRADPL